jgi:hypothetical protein
VLLISTERTGQAKTMGLIDIIKQIIIVSKVTHDMVMTPKETFDKLIKSVEEADKSGLLKQFSDEGQVKND